MLTVDAETILFGVAARAGMSSAEVAGTVFTDLRDALARRLRSGWQFAKWPDLMRIEKRFFRGAYADGTAYVGGNEVYYSRDGLYYQAVKGFTSSSVSRPLLNGVLNSVYWALAETSYSGADWDAATAYIWGDIVKQPENGKFYVAINAGTNHEPPDASWWKELVLFDRYVAYEQTGQTKFSQGSLMGVTDEHPKLNNGAAEVSFWLSENGVQVLEEREYVHLEFRLAVPRIKGAVYDAALVYTATTNPLTNAQIYFVPASGVGNFYDCVTTTNAGESPTTHAAKWSKVEIPAVLERYLVHGVYADWLEMDGQKEKSMAENAAADIALSEEWFVIAGQSAAGNGERSTFQS